LECIERDEDVTAPCLGLQPAWALGESPNIRTPSLRFYLLTFIFKKKNSFIASLVRIGIVFGLLFLTPALHRYFSRAIVTMLFIGKFFH